MYVPMDVGHVRGSEPQKEYWENLDEVRRGSMCSNYGIMGHVARDCGRKGMGKGKGGEGGKEYAQGRGDTTKDMGKERHSQIWRTQGRMFMKNRKFGDTKDRAGRAARSDTSYQNVDGKSLTSMRKVQTAENAEDNLILCCASLLCA